MSLANFTLADVKRLEKLLYRKSKLQAEVARIDRQLAGFGEGGGPAAPARGKAKKVRRKGGARGALKSKILASLKKAGAPGVHVKDLAKQLKVKEQNVRSWFFTTGKKLKEVKKAGPARYRWEA